MKRASFCGSFKALSTDISFIKIRVCYQKLSTLELNFHYRLSSHYLNSFVATEICRLRWNWFYLILLHCLDSINYNSPLPSLHQFVTNPTAQELNATGREVRSSPCCLNYSCTVVQCGKDVRRDPRWSQKNV